jgi:YVTN family beta-propeller protein
MQKVINISIFILIMIGCTFAQRWAYVINGNSETLSRINLQTGNVENHILTTGPVPNQIAYYNNLLYVVNSGSASLQIIDATNPHTIAEIPLPINSNPWNAAFWGDYAFVTGFSSTKVYKISLTTYIVIDSFSVGQSPAGIIVFNGKLYVTNTAFNQINNTYGQGSISVLNPANGHLIAQLDVGKNPQTLIAAPDSFINVICTGNYSSNRGSIYFIDSRNEIIADSLLIGGDPFWPCISSNGVGFISGGGWSGYGIVYSYNAFSRTIIHGANSPIHVGVGAMGLGLDSSGNLYSVGQMANAVTRFNQQGQVLATYQVGAGPVSIAIVDQRTSVNDLSDKLPENFSLGLAYPNPFNSSVIIPLNGQSAKIKDTAIDIFDITGHLIRTLQISDKSGNYRQQRWNGLNAVGKAVSSGVYFIHLRGTSSNTKIVLIR